MQTISTLTNQSGTSNDIFLDGNGNLATSKDIYALSNVISNAIRVQMGELQYDSTDGIPYLSTIFSNQTNVDLFEASIVDKISSFDQVKNVSSFEYRIENNVLTYTAKINTIYGEVVLNG